MPEKAVKCDRCGATAEQAFGEGGFGWWESLHCPSCGRNCEADGCPPIPDEYREIILREQGEWSLEAPTPVTTELLKALRARLSLSLTETKQLRDRLPGQISRGTRYEMQQILDAVRKQVRSAVLVVRPVSAQ